MIVIVPVTSLNGVIMNDLSSVFPAKRPPNAIVLVSIISRAAGGFTCPVRMPCALSARTASSAISSAPRFLTCV